MKPQRFTTIAAFLAPADARPGETVEIIDGAFKGRRGTIQAVDGEWRTIETTSPPLPSQQQTEIVRRRIAAAARARFHTTRFELFFEHEHWWARVGEQTFDVVDATGGPAINGFDFEEV